MSGVLLLLLPSQMVHAKSYCQPPTRKVYCKRSLTLPFSLSGRANGAESCAMCSCAPRENFIKVTNLRLLLAQQNIVQKEQLACSFI